MGCAVSKLHDSPPVTLCRERCGFLDDALRHRFALAQSHGAYLNSLNAFGVSLHRFLDVERDLGGGIETSSPVLKLPRKTKGEADSPPPEGDGRHRHHMQSRSHSGSHLHFHSDSDSFHHLDDTPPPEIDQHWLHGHHHPYYENSYLNLDGGGDGGGGFMKINYMRSQATASVVYSQMPVGATTVRLDESYRSSNPPPPYLNGYSDHSTGGDGDGRSVKPAPPSPPRTSSWDFLNPFEAFDRYYPPYPNDWKEIREEEGIPDLEDADNEVVKEVDGDRKLVANTQRNRTRAASAVEDHRPVAINPDPEAGPSDHTVEQISNTAIHDDESTKHHRVKQPIIKEIRVEFFNASESGKEVSEFLDVGTLPVPYKQKHKRSLVHVLHLPGLTSRISMSKNQDSEMLEMDQEMSKNLSSTLHEIYLWEKKLYEEVKVEEQTRALHHKKSIKLKDLDRDGAEANKVDAARTLLRSLSTKMKIAIQVVDRISMKINTLRDEHLCPQLYEFIHRLTRMWKSMLECHRSQREAIEESTRLDSIAPPQVEAISQLEHDLITWAMAFSDWFTAQRSFVNSLNNWLLKCLLYIPEETPDGPAPFSPGRIGAPQVFIICNQWSQSLDTISEYQVVDSMQELARNALQLWQQGKSESGERRVHKEDDKRYREIQALEKRIAQISRGGVGRASAVYQSDTSKRGSIQASLHRVVEALEKFTADSLKVYEELLHRISDITVVATATPA